jgi:protein TonB
MVGSTTVQIAIAATLIVIPMLHPERLAFHVETPLVFTPPPPRPPLPVQEQRASAGASSAPLLPVTMRPMVPSIKHTSAGTSDTPPLAGISNNGFGMSDPLGIAIMGTGAETAVSVAPARTPAKRLAISSGVSAGMLVTQIRPVYPAIARAAHVTGSVIVEAVISKAGTIESLHVISGPEMLRAAAMDAIREARYRPYKLNGEPTEVQTTITVNFTMGG